MQTYRLRRFGMMVSVLSAIVLGQIAGPGPRKIKDVRPVYPSESLQAGDEGVVLLELNVSPSGTVGQTRILWSQCKRLEQAALTAAGNGNSHNCAPTENRCPSRSWPAFPSDCQHDSRSELAGPVRANGKSRQRPSTEIDDQLLSLGCASSGREPARWSGPRGFVPNATRPGVFRGAAGN